MSEEKLELEGKVIAALSGNTFRVQLNHNQHELLARLSGKLRKNFIRIGVGDRVKVEMNPYDLTQATICFRLKETPTNVNPPKRSFGPRHGASRKPSVSKR